MYMIILLEMNYFLVFINNKNGYFQLEEMELDFVNFRD